MVGAAIKERDLLARAEAAARAVCDPELPPLTIAELGVLRGVETDADGQITIRITPTYSGCPAMTVIQLEIELALAKAGIEGARVVQELAPAWCSADISPEGRKKLAAMGIAPPPDASSPNQHAPCPRCGSANTEELSRFGATACKSLRRCMDCREPFEAFKPL